MYEYFGAREGFHFNSTHAKSESSVSHDPDILDWPWWGQLFSQFLFRLDKMLVYSELNLRYYNDRPVLKTGL